MVLNDFIAAYPITAIIILGCIVTLVSTLITKWLTDQEHLKSLKKRQKELQAEIKKNQKTGDTKILEEMQMEILKITGTMMKSQFKPLIITFIPFLLLLYWIKATFTPILGFSWFWYYLGAALISSIIIRKLFKMA